jgi:hypothetical protein
MVRTRTAGLVAAMMPSRLCCRMDMCARPEGARSHLRP